MEQNVADVSLIKRIRAGSGASACSLSEGRTAHGGHRRGNVVPDGKYLNDAHATSGNVTCDQCATIKIRRERRDVAPSTPRGR